MLHPIDDLRPDAFAPRNLVGIADLAELLHVAVVAAQHAKGVFGVWPQQRQAEQAHVVADVVDRLPPLAVGAEDVRRLGCRPASFGSRVCVARAIASAQPGSEQRGIGQANVDTDLFRGDTGHQSDRMRSSEARWMRRPIASGAVRAARMPATTRSIGTRFSAADGSLGNSPPCAPATRLSGPR